MTKHNLDARSYVFLVFTEFNEYDSEKIRPIIQYILTKYKKSKMAVDASFP